MILVKKYFISSFVYLLLSLNFSFGQEKSVINEDLVNAVKAGNTELVSFLLEKGADVESKNKAKSTCLMTASGSGHLEIVELLLQYNADVNAIKRTGRTALIMACMRGRMEIVKLLIENGANVNQGISSGLTPLITAAGSTQTEIIKLLIDSGADPTNVLFNRYLFQKNIVELLIEYGADVNAIDSRGQSAIMRAIEQDTNNLYDYLRVLLSNGANTNIKDIAGKSALKMAEETNNVDVALMLLEYGADINVVSKKFKERLSNVKDVPDEFLGWWLNKEFYDDLMSKKTPFQSRMGRIPYLFFKKEHQVMVTTSNEGWYENTEVKSENELIFEAFGRHFSAKLEKKNSGDEIVLADKKGKKNRYIRYPKKYRDSRPPDFLINEIHFAGKYIAQDSLGSELTFSIDGNLTGMKEYTKYFVGYSNSYPPNFDIIRFSRADFKNSKSFHWKYEEDVILLYHYNEVDDMQYEIGELYLKLKKIK